MSGTGSKPQPDPVQLLGRTPDALRNCGRMTVQPESPQIGRAGTKRLANDLCLGLANGRRQGTARGAEHTALETAPCELAKKPSTVGPGVRCGREVQGPARMLGQPFLNIGMLMGGIVMRRATVRDNCLKLAPIGKREVDDYSCSHAESLNCFGRFGDHPNESYH